MSNNNFLLAFSFDVKLYISSQNIFFYFNKCFTIDFVPFLNKNMFRIKLKTLIFVSERQVVDIFSIPSRKKYIVVTYFTFPIVEYVSKKKTFFLLVRIKNEKKCGHSGPLGASCEMEST